MRIDQLTDKGLREALSALAEARGPLRALTRGADQRVALAEAEANALRKLTSHLDTLVEIYMTEQARREALDQ